MLSIILHININILIKVDCSGAVSKELSDFFIAQDIWTREQVQNNPDCSYWSYIGIRLYY